VFTRVVWRDSRVCAKAAQQARKRRPADLRVYLRVTVGKSLEWRCNKRGESQGGGVWAALFLVTGAFSVGIRSIALPQSKAG